MGGIAKDGEEYTIYATLDSDGAYDDDLTDAVAASVKDALRAQNLPLPPKGSAAFMQLQAAFRDRLLALSAFALKRQEGDWLFKPDVQPHDAFAVQARSPVVGRTTSSLRYFVRRLKGTNSSDGVTPVSMRPRVLRDARSRQVWLRRRAFSGRVAALFETIDLLLIPAQSMASPTQAQMDTLGVDPEGFARLVKFSAPFNMSGSPTITLPGGFTQGGMPVAVQLVSAHLNEGLLVRAGRVFQRETDWHRKHPKLNM